MTKFAPIQNSFAGGEWGKLLWPRADLSKYQVALRKCQNFVVTPQGPLIRRSGTRFIAPVRYPSKLTRIKDFEYNTEQAYMIEIGDQYMRFFFNKAPLVEADVTITGITQASPAVVTAASHGYSNGDTVIIEDVVGMTEVNGRRFTVAGATTNTFQLSGIDSTGFTAYGSAGTVKRVYEIATNYLEADLATLKFVQTNDVLYIAHPSYPLATLSRTTASTFTLADVEFSDGPYIPANVTAETLALSGTSGSVTVTLSNASAVNGGDGFLATDVGRLIRWRVNSSSVWTWLKITARASTTSVTAAIVGPSPSAGTASAEWRLGLYSDTTGHPRTVGFYEDRLMLAGATSYPSRIDGSVPGDYSNFQPDDQTASSTVLADHAVAFTLNSRKANVIRAIVEDDKGLFALTSGGEWLLRAGNDDAISAENPPRAKKSLSYGSADIEPIEAGRSVLYVDKDTRRLRQLNYVFEDDGFRAPEMTLLADQISEDEIKRIAFQASPRPIAWLALGSGTLAGFSYEPDQEVLAWHRHVLGGASDAVGAPAKVEDVAAIPSQDGRRNEPWLVVQRYIDGAETRYIEVIETEWTTDSAKEDQFFVDCGLTYTGAATDTITGLEHAEGETVDVLVDGGTHAQKTVSGGSITLDREGETVHVGFHSDAIFTPMAFEGGAAQGTSQGRLKSINEVAIRYVNSLGGRIGQDEDSVDPIPDLEWYDPATTAWDAAWSLQSGWAKIEPDWDKNEEGLITFVQALPLASIIQAIAPRMETHEG